ncbi:uncharacterized protein TNCT_392651 [Trichonephila clavata]|uniref:Large T antigen polyomavirus C-terminal domain-containing protein n=1 Tax=Trichonephila clavata TaxID=2740835 RepID=A0A8X6JET0_TRICU|nr:uncharacterized protein TNCT_392651 [Trichonephila clavata]
MRTHLDGTMHVQFEKKNEKPVNIHFPPGLITCNNYVIPDAVKERVKFFRFTSMKGLYKKHQIKVSKYTIFIGGVLDLLPVQPEVRYHITDLKCKWWREHNGVCKCHFKLWNKLKRVVAYCLRFVKNCSLAACKRRKSFLTTTELSKAEKAIVKFIQHDHFSTEVSYLSAGKQLNSSNKLIPLTPFYDDFGKIRVGGRLKNSILPESQKHPILHPITSSCRSATSPSSSQREILDSFSPRCN